MIIKASKETLLQGIQTVQNVISPKTTLPILSNIFLYSKSNLLKFNATDLDIGISCELPVETVEEGGITVPAKRLSDVIREFPTGEVTIHAKKNHHVDISMDTCRFKLHGLSHEEFPKFPEFQDKEKVQLSQATFKEMLRLTAFAVSHEESRYVLNGVLFEISGNTIRLVATDGRRLAKIEKRLEQAVEEDMSVIIPSKAIQEINRNLTEEGDVAFMIGINQVLFDISGVLIATRIIEGEFPNYQQVIPQEAEEKARLKTQEFLAAIRRANLLATPDFQAIKFEVFKDKLVVSKTTPDVGESREEIPSVYKGEELVVGFNPHFLIDFLKNITEETIDLELLGPDKPAVVRLPDYLYLTLPMRV